MGRGQHLVPLSTSSSIRPPSLSFSLSADRGRKSTTMRRIRFFLTRAEADLRVGRRTMSRTPQPYKPSPSGQRSHRPLALKSGASSGTMGARGSATRWTGGHPADRVSGPRTVVASFLGRQASFPAGPFLIAATLRCPVYLAFGLYFAPRRYEFYCESLVEAIHLPRAGRDAALAEVVAAYAARLKHNCRLAPDNWFNFFDFFTPPPAPPGPPSLSL
jgi:hypothetical protein